MSKILNKNIILIGFVISFLYCTITKIFNFNGFIDDVKFLMFFFIIVMGGTYIYINKISIKLTKELLYMVSLILVLFMITIVINVTNKSIFTFRMIVELLYILIPAMLAFIILNISSRDDVIKLIKIILLGSLGFYFVEILMTMSINLEELLSISFVGSYSPFESYIFADISIACLCFFSYLIKGKKENSYLLSNKKCYILSLLFVILTFKRIHVLFSFVIVCMDVLKIKNYIVNKKIIMGLVVLFFITTLVYTWLLEGNHAKILLDLFSFDFEKFTVGRKWYFSIIENNVQMLNGYGSTTVILNHVLANDKYLEMDLVKVLVETGYIGLFYFIFAYSKQIFNDMFSVLIYLYLFTNLLFSHSLTTFYAWTLFFIIFYLIKLDNVIGE